MVNRILWLGSMASDLGLRSHAAMNQAAVKWSRGLLQGLGENGVEVVAISHCAERAFPKGEFWPGRPTDFDWNGLEAAIHYPNIKGLRDMWLSWRYVSAAKRLFAQQKIDAVVCYNVLHPYHVATLRAAAERSIPCFPIILDGDDPRQDKWAAILKGTRHANGVVFLSQWAAKQYPGKQPVLHLDGGCAAWYGDEADVQTESNLIVYSGGLDHWRGLDFLVDVVRRLEDANYKIIICGKCNRNAIQLKFGNDPRVEVKGFVSDEELHKISCRAAVFLNTRDPKIADNILNFPSKIPNYLAYGKPTVSTWVESFSPEYRKVLQIVENETPEAFADKVNQVMKWSPETRHNNSLVLKDWFCQNKLWDKQAERLVKWIQSLEQSK